MERRELVVLREELKQRLWPDGSFVDFEQSPNKAVNKPREALADSADKPRYVETLARQGYRFIAPVDAEAPAAPPVAVLPLETSKRNRRGWILGLAALVAVVVVTGLWPAPEPQV